MRDGFSLRKADFPNARQHFFSEVSIAGDTAQRAMELIYQEGQLYSLLPKQSTDADAEQVHEGGLIKGKTIGGTCDEANESLQKILRDNVNLSKQHITLLREPYLRIEELSDDRKANSIFISGNIFGVFSNVFLKKTLF